MYAKIITRRS